MVCSNAVSADEQMARKIAAAAAEYGGRVYFVGGCVRDRLMGVPCKDIDIEVHGIEQQRLEAILDTLGERLEFGKSFGIYGLRHCSLDIALPRTEVLTGVGHKDFDVRPDPFIGTYKAALRRDFTVNALMQDVLSGEIIDHFHGREDLAAGILRHVSDSSFGEDPLRVLRGAQFAARFEFDISPQTDALCSAMDLAALPKERVFDELCKALLKADRPSVFFESLRRQNQLQTWFPEVQSLIDVPQDPSRHAEGDVWNHTMLVLDAAASLRARASDALGFMLAALLHDIGKPLCTQEIAGRIHAYDHEFLGLVPAEQFLDRLTNRTNLKKYILNLVKLHMRPNILAQAQSSVKKTNHLFDEAVDPAGLAALACADAMGQRPLQDWETTDAFLRERLRVFEDYMARPYVQGRDLTSAGINPGPQYAEILRYAHKLRLAGIEKDSALKQTLAYAKKLERKSKG